MLGFISDAHGNAAALDAGLRALRDNGATDIFFLGDAIGYLPGTGALEMLIDENIPSIRGNHEAMCLGYLDPGANAVVYQLPEFAGLPDALAKFLLGLPESKDLVEGGMLAVHGSPVRPTDGYVYPDTDLDGFPIDRDWVVMGHTHWPFVREHNGTTFVNCGSCAFPRDGCAEGSAALIDPERGIAHVIRFDIQTAIAEALQVAGLHPVTRGALEKLVTTVE